MAYCKKCNGHGFTDRRTGLRFVKGEDTKGCDRSRLCECAAGPKLRGEQS